MSGSRGMQQPKLTGEVGGQYTDSSSPAPASRVAACIHPSDPCAGPGFDPCLSPSTPDSSRTFPCGKRDLKELSQEPCSSQQCPT